MKLETWKVTLGASLIVSTLLVGCGNSSSNTTSQDGDNTAGSGGSDTVNSSASNIPYLRENHANYKEHGSQQTPAPTKDANARSIHWTIAATTEDGAEKLAGHIIYMIGQLEADQNPRGWDKLFLMEAYMKYNKYYTTSVEKSATNVVVSKVANTACAYEVISAHSDAVSGDFFARGALMVDYSSRAEAILASSACNDVRTSLESYISARQSTRGNGGGGMGNNGGM